ncbi:uncharacterized protein C8orf88 homolog isoform 1-T2 [Lycodopsis pacificus]
MEVHARRTFQKHLEPARPLRRCMPFAIEPKINAAKCAQAVIEEPYRETTIGIEEFYQIVNLYKQTKKKGSISYTRDFLIGLANCPEARKKPEFLPDHPIVLMAARDLGHLHEMR